MFSKGGHVILEPRLCCPVRYDYEGHIMGYREITLLIQPCGEGSSLIKHTEVQSLRLIPHRLITERCAECCKQEVTTL